MPAGNSASAPGPTESEQQAARDQAARDAKAKALRERRQLAASQAEADLARRRAEAARARSEPAATLPAPPPAPRAAEAMPPPEPARGVQERCAGRNPLSKGICEARECMRAERANDPVCQRIRADDDRRRQQF